MRAGGWVPRLPRPAWLVLGGDALSAVGTGMSMPFLVVYLHTVRGLSVGVAGAAASTIALAGFVGNPLGGWLADKVGARRAVILGLAIAAVGAFGYTLVRAPWHAFPAAAVSGLGIATVWPAQAALLAALVPAAQRSSVFSVHHSTMNAGLAVGGLLAALIVGDGGASRFVTLYLVDAATFLVFIPVLLAVPATKGVAPPAETESGSAPGTWRDVVADRVFRRVWLLTAIAVAVGYAQFNTSFPAFATRPGGIAPGTLGLVFAVNTAAVVGLQLVTLRLVRGWRRTTAFAAMGLCWAAAWAITLAAGEAGGGATAVVLFAVVAVVFAVGETFLSPSMNPMVNDLASDELRGRYNGMYTLAWTSGFAVGPVAGGFLLSAGRPGVLFGGAAVISAGLAIAAVRLRKHLPDGVDLISADDEVREADGAVAAMTGEVV